MTTPNNAPGAEGAGLGGGAAPAPDAGSTPWFSNIPDADLRGWVEQAGYKDPASLAKSHRDLMAFRGVPPERLAQIPENWDNPEQAGAFYERLGRPKTSKEYGIEPAAGYDNDFYDFMLGMLHEGGASTRQAQRWVKGYEEYAMTRMAKEMQAEADQSTAAIASLRGEWGNNYGPLEEQARRAFRKFGGDEAQMAQLEGAMGTAGFLKLFQRIGEQMGESSFVQGDRDPSGGGFNTLSPNGAKARKDALMQDKAFLERYMKGEAAAIAEVTRLQQMEAAGMEPPTAASFNGPPGARK